LGVVRARSTDLLKRAIVVGLFFVGSALDLAGFLEVVTADRQELCV
jgi:hypothetical protein